MRYTIRVAPHSVYCEMQHVPAGTFFEYEGRHYVRPRYYIERVYCFETANITPVPACAIVRVLGSDEQFTVEYPTE